VGDGCILGKIGAAVGEAVGRDVDDAHETHPIKDNSGCVGARLANAGEHCLHLVRCATSLKLGSGKSTAVDLAIFALDHLGGGERQIRPSGDGNRRKLL
jgi:hypothetical protein